MGMGSGGSGGWIIQGVRGEGKSLAAVGKIKEYMLRGRPVATNLTLYLDGFLPPENASFSYRLPDHPRLEDFQMLPPAYDPKYKGDDMNGLLVLDELGTWLNARNWSDKKRLEVLNWLFLSRKDHWDIILLAQDFEMIDAQVRTTLCDYLVQASRSDRQKIPYLGKLFQAFGGSGKFSKVHNYNVYYGMSTNQPPEERWSFTGTDLYNGYDTNQKFLNGMEPLAGTLVDMRATYTNIPANYLSRQVFVDRLNEKISELQKITNLEGETVAKKKGSGASGSGDWIKIGLLSAGLVAFIGWRLLSGGGISPKPTAPAPVAASPAPSPAPVAAVPVKSAPVEMMAQETEDFMDFLLKTYRPRLSVSAYSPQAGFFGNVDFYQGYDMVERYKIDALHSFGVALIHKPYGADLIYKGKIYVLTAWLLPHEADDAQQTAEPVPVAASAVPSSDSLLSSL